MDNKSAIIQALQVYFSNQKDIVLAYLYGSAARGEENPLSDIDLAVLLSDNLDSQQRFERRVVIITQLIELLKSNRADVVTLNDTPLVLNYRVIRDGILLHAAHETARIVFTATTINQYLDFLIVPLLGVAG